MDAIGVASKAIDRIEMVEESGRAEFLGIMRTVVRSFKNLPSEVQRDPEVRSRAESISRMYSALKKRSRHG